MTDRKIHKAFRLFSEWRPHLPTPELRALLEGDWMARSRDGRWAPYMRLLGQRSPAYWRDSDIVSWFRLQFGSISPAAVDALIAAGFEPPNEPEPLIKRMKKQLGKKGEVPNAEKK